MTASGVKSPERRWFIGQAALALAGAALTPQVPIGIRWLFRMFPADSPPIPPPVLQRTIFDVYGLHDAPDIGGSIDIDLALSDTKRLGAHGLTAINPSEGLLEAFKAAGIPILSRIYQPKNRFNASYLRREVAKISRCLEGRPMVVQPFNEVNLLTETGERYITPESHIKNHFLPAVEIIASYGGVTLLTPLAPRAGNELEYFTKMLSALKALRPHKSDLEGRIALGLHAYIFAAGEDPLEYVQERYRFARNRLGFDLDVYVPEGGLFRDASTKDLDRIAPPETIRILNTPIPADLPLKRFDLWVASNSVQRRLVDSRDQKTLEDFEVAALRRASGETETFLAIEKLAARRRLPILQVLQAMELL